MVSRVERIRRTKVRRVARPRPVIVSPPDPGTLTWIEARQKALDIPKRAVVNGERPEFYTREAAAKRLGVGRTTVWELTRRGLIGVAYIGSKPLIPAVELDRYIASLVEQARERAEACYRPAKRRG